MSDGVIVRTGARLHFGLAISGSGPARRYGGLGMMIDQPGFEVRCRRLEDVDAELYGTESSRDRIAGPEWSVRRTQKQLDELRSAGRLPKTSRFDFAVVEAIPQHCGFGSGTQLALAVFTAATELSSSNDNANTSPRREPSGDQPAKSPTACASGLYDGDLLPSLNDFFRLKAATGRGRRSKIGLYGFLNGGLIHEVDRDRSESERFSREAIPESWRFVLITPEQNAGPSGNTEADLMQKLPPMSPRLTNRLHELASRILQAATNEDFPTFSEELSQYGRLVGAHFQPAQGGTFFDERIERIDRVLADRVNGPRPVQSSWGPTAVLPVQSDDAAAELIQNLNEHGVLDDCEVLTTRPLNRGASIEYVAD
ncbi:hypothetical protein [Stratiformator vulcanicus]|uniref:GHMP kinase C-terminal domain-containing protein n=1 Tax=Stratiformator vulcanicus TaxID=2527980 RepID=A0A517R2L1_9PLAN|nr:hypothetical protein [Stratiformator vulcanicus]QDT38119.1 hypothetical protein Pan189_25090 [Stratiformator vulcanicus]